MAYRLDHAEAPFQGLLRAIGEQLASAVDALNRTDAEAVHQARKCCKKARSALRLARPAFEAIYRRENRVIGEAARALSDLRDAQVLAATLDRQFPGDKAAAKCRKSCLDPSAGQTTDAAAKMARARDLLAGSAERLTRARPRKARGWLPSAWRRTRRRARQALRRAERHRTPASFHELRKRFKDFWYHARLLRDLAPKPMDRSIRKAAALTELLGEHHDLTILDRRLKASKSPPRRILGAIRKRQRLLERQALRAARKTIRRSTGAKSLATT